MHTDSNRNADNLIDDDDDVLLIGTVPTMREDVFVLNDDAGDLDDESGVGDESTAGVRSMGGAVGTQHRHPD